ncbi:MAG: RluA family pseudouridine synthase [Oscillospiraceae bacterium]|nr:RluA family pseudouridine synthase [Oscillospiraceae bacterium]
MEIVYLDRQIVVVLKPAGLLSTDEPGGVPELLREQLHTDEIRTVHRLDRVVGGLMLLARSAEAASELSRQIRDGAFDKRYLAVVHGRTPDRGELRDLLLRDRSERKTYVVQAPAKGVQEAVLRYETPARAEGLSLVRIELVTGRTHQIRCQFSSRGWPLVGDRKYSLLEDGCDIALWSQSLSFRHPASGEALRFEAPPPAQWPWTVFQSAERE